ncbi:MAG: MFS transporter [Streptosporangiales bacterium]|nr:MFS transporter [Streptosporangiales bacterium]
MHALGHGGQRDRRSLAEGGERRVPVRDPYQHPVLAPGQRRLHVPEHGVLQTRQPRRELEENAGRIRPVLGQATSLPGLPRYFSTLSIVSAGGVRGWFASRLLAHWPNPPPYFVPTATISFLLVVGINILAPVLPLYAETFGVTATQIGLVISAFAIGRFFFDLIGGSLADRFGFRALAVAGCGITAAAALVAGLTSSYPTLLAARAVQGAGSALYTTSAMGFVLALASPANTGRLVALYQGALTLGLALGPTIGGAVAAIFGLNGPFFAYALMGLVGLVWALVRLPGRDAESATQSAARGERARPNDRWTRWSLVRTLLTGRAFVLSMLVAAVVFLVRSGLRNTLVPLYAARELSLNEAAIGLLLTGVAIGNVSVVVHVGRVLDRRGRRPVIIGSLAATAVVVGLFAVSREPWMLFVTGLLFGMVTGYSMAAPTVMVADVADARIRSTAVGIQRMATDFGLFVGPISVGFLVDVFTFDLAFVSVSVLLLAAAVAALAAMPETKQQPAA